MGTATWITYTLMAGVGAYWIYVELGLTQKTPLLFLGIVLTLPFLIKVFLTIKNK